jgi:hypothetical protein
MSDSDVKYGHIFSHWGFRAVPAMWCNRLVWHQSEYWLYEIKDHPTHLVELPTIPIPIDRHATYIAIVNVDQLSHFFDRIRGIYEGPYGLLCILISGWCMEKDDRLHSLYIGANYHFSYKSYIMNGLGLC